MIDKLKKILVGRKSLNDYLAEAGLSEEDLKNKMATFEFDASFLTESQKSKLENESGLLLHRDTANFTGMEIISCTSSAITILSALISLEKWLGSKFFVSISSNNLKQKVTINQAIKIILGVNSDNKS